MTQEKANGKQVIKEHRPILPPSTINNLSSSDEEDGGEQEMRRYPKRDLPRIDYGVLEDDHFICEIANS